MNGPSKLLLQEGFGDISVILHLLSPDICVTFQGSKNGRKLRTVSTIDGEKTFKKIYFVILFISYHLFLVISHKSMCVISCSEQANF